VRYAASASVLIFALATAALMAGGGAAAKTPPKRVTATGKITVLKVKTIRVHGSKNLTCRITTASPKVTLRGFTLGATAKITCSRGVLLAIMRPDTGATVQPTGTVSNPKPEPQPDPSVEPPGTGGPGGVKTAPSVAGTGTITLLSSSAVEFGDSITCQLGPNSPSVSGFKVGARVSYTCSGGMLTTIGPGEGT